MCCCFYFNGLTSTCINIVLITASAISFFFSLLTLAIIKWSKIEKFSLALTILIFLLSLSILAITILLLYWRKNGTIKTTTKDISQKLSVVGFILTIVLFVLCFISVIVFAIQFRKANHPCVDFVYVGAAVIIRNLGSDDVDCYLYSEDAYVSVVTPGQYAMAYICLVYTEFAMAISIFLWRIYTARIIAGLEEPNEENDQNQAKEQQPAQTNIINPIIINQGQISPQYVVIQGNGQNGQTGQVQYIVQGDNMNDGNNYVVSGQYPNMQQMDGKINEKGNYNDNFNVVVKPGVNNYPEYPGTDNVYTSGRNMKNQ